MTIVTEYKFEVKPEPAIWLEPVGPQAQLRIRLGQTSNDTAVSLEFISVKFRTSRSIELDADTAARLTASVGSFTSQCRSLAAEPRAEQLLRILTSIAADLSGYGLSAEEWDMALEEMEVKFGKNRFPGLTALIEPGRVYGKAKARLATAEDVEQALIHLSDTEVGAELIKVCGRRDAAGVPVQVWLEKDLQQLVFRDANRQLISSGQLIKQILRKHYAAQE